MLTSSRARAGSSHGPRSRHRNASPGGLVGVALTFSAINVLDSALQSVVPASGWFDEEIGILGAAVLSLLLALAVMRRGRWTKPASVAVPAES